MKKTLTFSILLVTILGMSACTLNGPADNQVNSPEQVGTSAASTLTAIAEQPDLIGTSVAATLAAEANGGDNPNDADLIGTSVAATLNAAADVNDDAPQATPDLGPQPLQIVYIVNGGDIWLWTEGVGAAELLSGQSAYDVKLSDDGQVIAFLVSGGENSTPSLWAINADGSNLRELVDTAAFNNMMSDPNGARIAPSRWEFVAGTHTLAFNTQVTFNGPGLLIQDDLRLLDVDSGVLTTLLDTDQGGDFYYSPDGSQIALVTPTDISLINADGSNRRDSLIAFDSVITYSSYQFYPKVRWAADNSKLWAVIPSPDILDINPTIEVFEIPANGSPADSLGSIGAYAPLFGTDTTVSPDLTTVAFARQVAGNIQELHFGNPITFDFAFFHSANSMYFQSWSPDSDHFSFQIDGVLYIGQVGAGFDFLSGVNDARRMQWVDETSYIYVKGSSQNWELWLGTLAGGDVLLAGSNDFSMISFDFSE